MASTAAEEKLNTVTEISGPLHIVLKTRRGGDAWIRPTHNRVFLPDSRVVNGQGSRLGSLPALGRTSMQGGVSPTLQGVLLDTRYLPLALYVTKLEFIVAAGVKEVLF